MLHVRSTFLPALTLILAGALVACGAEETPTSQPTAEPTAAETSEHPDGHSTSPDESPEESDTPAPAKNLISVTIAGSEITPGPGKVKVPLGEKVTVEVTSDVAEEVHLHGYDKYIDLEPGKLSKLTFTADIPGVFEAELEGSGKLLFELEVK